MLPNSRDIWSRIGLLLFILCAVKVIILAVLRKQLFEEHWRVDSDVGNWVNAAAFFAFALLVGANLWTFGKRCKTLPKRSIYVANAMILLVGFLFILLTFHSGDESYLYLLMHNVLGFGNIGWNLQLHFFFQWPYVGGWILVYALMYYFLVRSGRGQFILQVTAVFAFAYLSLCLNDLQEHRGSLIMADVLGVASLVSGRAKKSASLVWLALPWVSVGLLYLLFCSFTVQLSHPGKEFLLLAGVTTALFAMVTLAAWRYGFYASWTWVLPFSFFAFLLLVDWNYLPAANYDKFLCLGLGMSRYFLGEFALALILLGAATVYRRIHPRGKLWWLDAINLFLLLLALVDLKLSQTIGARLDCHLLAFGDSPKMMWRLAQPYLPVAMGALLAIIAFYLIAVWLIGQWRPRQAVTTGGSRWEQGGLFFAVAFVLSGLAGNYLATRDKALGQTVFLLIKTSSLWSTTEYKPWDAKTFNDKVVEMGVDVFSPDNIKPPQIRRDLNVVIIFQESTYNKYLSLFGGTNGTEPLLSGYKDRMELYPNFFSDFAGSIYARFATFTSLYPTRDFHQFTIERVGVKSLFEALHDQGYSCSMFYSSFFDYTSFRDFLRNRGLDEMYDAETMPGVRKMEPVTWGLREEETLGAMQDRINKYAADKTKFCLTYIPAAPHQPFDSIPDEYRKYKMTEYGNSEPNYLNEITYMDWIVTSVVDSLRTNGLLDNTLVVITADHGEMLGVNGGPIGHGWVVTPELANVPLIIMDPGKPGYRVNQKTGSEIDLFPTVMDILGLPMPTHNLYQGVSLLDTNSVASTNRLVYLNSLRQYAVISGKDFICGDRESELNQTEPYRKVYEIENDGAHTSFRETQDVSTRTVPLIEPFGVFQENFLHNYTRYCDMVWGGGNAK